MCGIAGSPGDGGIPPHTIMFSAVGGRLTCVISARESRVIHCIDVPACEALMPFEYIEKMWIAGKFVQRQKLYIRPSSVNGS